MPDGPTSRHPLTATTDPARSGRKRRRSRGQALVEFALVFPLFILLLAAMIDFGIGLYSYQTLINSARDGARLASTACSVAPCAGAVTARVAVAAGGLGPGVTVTCVTVAGAAEDCTTGTAARGDMVTVTATYTYRMIWPLAFGTTIPMTSSVQYMVE